MPDLGMIDPKASTLELSVAGRDFSITQSPGALQSGRKEGTTGAAVWQSSVRVAGWLASPTNALFTKGLLNSDSTVLELGTGISGLVPCVLASKVGAVVATDQQHLLKALRANVDANVSQTPAKSPKRAVHKPVSIDRGQASTIKVLALDWEEDDIKKQLASHGLTGSVDVVLACDCIFNYALIEPFVQTCVDICRLRAQQIQEGGDQAETRPTVCVVTQQLRQAEVFEQWLQTSIRSFRVWRMSGDMLADGLKGGSGFAVHVCILREGDAN